MHPNARTKTRGDIRNVSKPEKNKRAAKRFETSVMSIKISRRALQAVLLAAAMRYRLFKRSVLFSMDVHDAITQHPGALIKVLGRSTGHIAACRN